MTKTIEEILKAPVPVRTALSDFAGYLDAAVELRDDIDDRYPYPSLWAAIDMLLEYTKSYAEARATYEAAGYTMDDAFTLHQWEEGGCMMEGSDAEA